MGAAAENRYKAMVRRQNDGEACENSRIALQESLNCVAKKPGAGTPFGDVLFANSGDSWWALDPVKKWAGFGYCYGSIREAVACWNVAIFVDGNNQIIGQPIKSMVRA